MKILQLKLNHNQLHVIFFFIKYLLKATDKIEQQVEMTEQKPKEIPSLPQQDQSPKKDSPKKIGRLGKLKKLGKKN